MKKIGIIVFVMGIVFLGIHNTFYGYVDADGVLHDSLFLPLGVCAIIIGISSLLLSGV